MSVLSRFKFDWRELLPGKPNMQDAIAGLTLAPLLLPQVLAYSGIANLPAQAGIIALFAGLLCYGIFGASRFAIVSPTSSAAVVCGAATLSIGGDDPGVRMMLASALILATGILFIIASFIRAGSITDFIARPVLRGFTIGLSAFIIVNQFGTVVGIKSPHTNLFLIIYDILKGFASWNLPCIIVLAASLAVFYAGNWIRTIKNGRFSSFPGAGVVIVLGIIVSVMMDLTAHGVPVVGEIKLGFSQVAIPSLDLDTWQKLFEIGVALVFILYAESYASIRSLAMKRGDPTSPNRDLFALGICNIVSGLFQGMPVGAGYSASVPNEQYGAKTRLSGLFCLVACAAVILTALNWIAYLPVPVLCAIVIGTMTGNLGPRNFRLYFGWRVDRITFLAAIACVLFLGVLQGLILAIVLSIALMLRQNARASISRLGQLEGSHDYVDIDDFPNAKELPQILIIRPDQNLFFANADRILTLIRREIATCERNIEIVIISMEMTTDVDSTTLEAMCDFFRDTERRGLQVILARLKDPVYKQMRFTIGRLFSDLSFSRLSTARAVSQAQIKTGHLNMEDFFRKKTPPGKP